MTTKERNEAFAMLTPEQKRVAIASDVLSYLEVKRVTVMSGTYYATKDIVSAEEILSKQACEVVASVKDCQVCAVGAIFMATVERANAVTVDALGGVKDGYSGLFYFNDCELFNYLSKFFDIPQLILIESAFEGTVISSRGFDDLEDRFHDAAAMFQWLKYGDEDFDEDADENCATSPEDRMRAIMQNIVANNGTFIP